MIPIRPEHIDVTQRFWDAFDSSERELSAWWIVKFCQERGEGWEPFTMTEIEQFYQAHGHQRFHFNGLDNHSRYGIEIDADLRYIIKP